MYVYILFQKEKDREQTQENKSPVHCFILQMPATNQNSVRLKAEL